MAEKNVRVIQPTAALIRNAEIKRVAAYCRVSTDKEDAINSFSAQLKYYNDFIRNNSNFEFVDIYADEGISGTSINKRDEFKRMMSDAEKGKIDRIYVKSISRFARNVLECMESIRKLTALGVTVMFENDNIDTSTMSSELVLYVKSAFAQSEALAGAQRCSTAIRMKMENGEFITCYAPYGYKLDKKHSLVVDEEQAKTVKRIFSMYLEGTGTLTIAKILNSEGIASNYGKWTSVTVCYILRNEKYIGDSLLRKSYTPLMLPLKKQKNHGEVDQYYIENSHEAIIDRETYELANARLHRHKQEPEKKEKHQFTGMIECGACGWNYSRHSIKETYFWGCPRQHAKGVGCSGRDVKEEEVKKAFVETYNKLRFFEKEVIDPALSQINQLKKQVSMQNNEMLQIDSEIAKLCERLETYADLQQKGVLDNATVMERTSEAQYKLDNLRKKRQKLLTENEDEQKTDELAAVKDILKHYPKVIFDFDEILFADIVEKVIIDKNGNIVFRIKGGLELTHKEMIR